MRDFILKFPDEAAARADRLVGKHWSPGGLGGAEAGAGPQWIGPVTQPMTVCSGGKPVPGFWIMIAGYDDDAALAAHPAMRIVLRRQGHALMIASSRIGAADIHIEPLPHGMHLAPP